MSWSDGIARGRGPALANGPYDLRPMWSVPSDRLIVVVSTLEELMSAVPVPTAIEAGGDSHLGSAELSSRQTGMAFQRTRMSADRTLMSVIRTGLSLISFGFTIYQFFGHLADDHVLKAAHAPRRFGGTLVYLGVGMVAVGILFPLQFMRGLRDTREDLKLSGLIHGTSHFPISYTL